MRNNQMLASGSGGNEDGMLVYGSPPPNSTFCQVADTISPRKERGNLSAECVSQESNTISQVSAYSETLSPEPSLLPINGHYDTFSCSSEGF